LGNGLPLGSAVTLKSRFFLYSTSPIRKTLTADYADFTDGNVLGNHATLGCFIPASA
jgi:hypothetical protein